MFAQPTKYECCVLIEIANRVSYTQELCLDLPILCKKSWYSWTIEFTLYNAILRIARNFLEIRENINILTHPFYLINLGWFSWEWSKKKIFFSKKKFKMADSKKAHFSKSPILKIFLWKFHGSVLGLEGLIDAKGIDLSQPIWLWGCPT